MDWVWDYAEQILNSTGLVIQQVKLQDYFCEWNQSIFWGHS